MQSRPPPLSSNTLPPPPTSLLYLSSLYSLCRLYDFHAAPRDSQKKRKDALQGSSALLGLIAMPRLRGRSDQPPLYLFLLPLYIPYIILTPTRGKLFEQQKVGDVFFGGGAFALCFSISLFFYQKEKKGKLAFFAHYILVSLFAFPTAHSSFFSTCFNTCSRQTCE